MSRYWNFFEYGKLGHGGFLSLDSVEPERSIWTAESGFV
jgi:hypothetical protein